VKVIIIIIIIITLHIRSILLFVPFVLLTANTKAPFVCRKVVSFWKVNSGESEFLESIFRYLTVLWKMNWKTLSSVCLCYEK
jgi:hypothetical protein